MAENTDFIRSLEKNNHFLFSFTKEKESDYFLFILWHNLQKLKKMQVHNQIK